MQSSPGCLWLAHDRSRRGGKAGWRPPAVLWPVDAFVDYLRCWCAILVTFTSLVIRNPPCATHVGQRSRYEKTLPRPYPYRRR